MAAPTPLTDAEIRGLQCEYSVGAPMTRAQMLAERAADAQAQAQPRHDGGLTLPDEEHPHLFDDRPVDHNAFAVVSVARPGQHPGDGVLLKIRAVHDSVEAAAAAAKALPTERCDTCIYELYKFCVLPYSAALCEMGAAERDAAMNRALELYKRRRIESDVDFARRKQVMLDDMQQQEATKAKIRAGEAPEDTLDSSCALPAEVVAQKAAADPDACRPKLRSDEPTSSHRFAVLAIVDMADVDGVDEAVRGSVFVKINGVFRSQDDATAHAEKLRKEFRYRHIDIYVAHLFEWLACPPDSALLEHVVYGQNKLNEALGKREFTAADALDAMRADDPGVEAARGGAGTSATEAGSSSFS